MSPTGDYYALAHTTGLYTPAEAAGVAGNMTIINVNPTGDTVDLMIELATSLDLQTFTPMTLNPAKLSVDANGNIRYELDTPDGKRFFRAEWK